MKTPDEIKKGLECCQTPIKCEQCPYEPECELPFGDAINADALAYIQQLEREKDALLKDLRATDPCDNCKHGDTAWECDGDCSFCDHSETCQCRECDDDSHWEWAGIKEDNK